MQSNAYSAYDTAYDGASSCGLGAFRIITEYADDDVFDQDIRIRRIKNQFTVSIEVGLQNSALAIFVAATLLKSHSMALVPVVYGSFTFFSTLFFGWVVKKLAWQSPFSGKDA